MLEKGKASKTVYPDGTEKKGFFMQVDEELLLKFKVRTTEKKTTMVDCLTKFIKKYTK